MAERKWTDEQKQCIYARGGTVLVSAAAGSGKTAVLIERILQRITDENDPVDIDKLLVVTFTRAAAAEMKQRLAKGLRERLAENPHNRNLLRQQMLLPTADITTMDAFCQKLVRENATALDLPVDFRLDEGSRILLMKYDALDEVLEKAYAENTPGFKALSDLYVKKNDDDLREAILRTHAFLQALPLPFAFLRSKIEQYKGDVPFEASSFGKEFLLHLTDLLTEACHSLSSVEALVSSCPLTPDAPLPAFLVESQRAFSAALAVVSGDSDFEEKLNAVRAIQMPNFSKKELEPSVEPAARTLYGGVRDILNKSLRPLSAFSAADHQTDCERLYPMLTALADVTEAFDKRLWEMKVEAGILGFSDLERCALNLLTEEKDGALTQSERGQRLAARYKEVLIDEFQDTNELQNALFCALSDRMQNLFFVGDAKQSIYGFRRTSPDAFIARRDNSFPFDGTHFPARILLGHNFRSRRSVTDAVNFLFSQLMHEKTGSIRYADGEQLVCAADYPPNEQNRFAPTLLLLETEKDAEDPLSTPVLEARAIAAEIARMMEDGTVSKDGVTRRPAFSDFAILLRTCKDKDYLYARELIAAGIPAVTDGAEGSFFEAPEIQTALSLLRFIDNPLLDMALLAVLLSPLYGFSPDDVARIRLLDRHHSLYHALRLCAKGHGELSDRCAAFLKTTDTFRVLAATVPADRLLWHIYEVTDLPAVTAMCQNGDNRNLQLLFEYARGFEQNGFRGLSAFLRFFDRLSEQGQSPSAAKSAAADNNAVRIMSIHASKGLEFPFVYVASIHSAFNTQDTTGTLLLHDRAGIASKWLNDDTLETHSPVSREGVKYAHLRDNAEEGLRLLYVAATRAREKLTFVGTYKNLASALDKAAASAFKDGKLSAGSVRLHLQNSHWILSALLHHPSAGVLRKQLSLDPPELIPDDTAWDIRILQEADIRRPTVTVETDDTPAAVSAREDLKNGLRERFSFDYPYKSLAAVPGKLAASDVAHSTHSRRFVATAVPAFLRDNELTAAEKGTATHTFMQFADWASAAADLASERERLVTAGKLTAAQAEAVDLDAVARFFQSPLYARICKATTVWRELPFTVNLSVKDYALLSGDPVPENETDESLLVQGIADCVFEENGELVILDYKTDRVKEGATLRDRYAPQLQLYAKALSETLGKPVSACLIYSFALAETIEVEKEIG